MGGSKSLAALRIDEIASLRLTDSIDIEAEYDEKIWCLTTTQLNAVGCGYTLTKALENLEESVLGAYELYVKELKKSELSEKAMELRRNLRLYISKNSYEIARKQKA